VPDDNAELDPNPLSAAPAGSGTSSEPSAPTTTGPGEELAGSIVVEVEAEGVMVVVLCVEVEGVA